MTATGAAHRRDRAAAGLPVYRAEAVRRADLRAQELGIAGMTLMERAGAGAWRVIRRYLDAAAAAEAGPPGRPGTSPSPGGGSRRARRILVLAGRGNNGGDGLVVARLAHAEGYPVTAVLLGRPGDLRGDAAGAFRRAREAGVDIVPLEEEIVGAVADALLPRLADAFLVVDALLGTGSRGAPQGALAEVIEAVNRWRDSRGRRERPTRALTAALDLPSGLDPDTGWTPGAAVIADLTVTFGAMKTGLLMGPAARFTGPVHLVDIGIPPAALPAADAHLVTPATVRADLPSPDLDAHKGSRGRVLVVAGSRGMTGAAVLAALGALRGGAGLACAAVPGSERPLVAMAVPEALTLPLPDDGRGRLADGAAAVLRAVEPGPDAVVLGPGLGRAPAVAAVVRDLLGHAAVPVVIDADALNALAAEPGALDRVGRGPGPRLLTPHPGEAARLLNVDTGTVQHDRPDAARALARRSGAVVLLKGARSLVAEPSGALWIVPTGSPALATGGTGDVLAGLIGALLAGGLSPVQAARAGAFLHGWAGQRVARRLGSHGLLAGDLPAAIARARAALVRVPGPEPEPAPVTGPVPVAADRRLLRACGLILEQGVPDA